MAFSLFDSVMSSNKHGSDSGLESGSDLGVGAGSRVESATSFHVESGTGSSKDLDKNLEPIGRGNRFSTALLLSDRSDLKFVDAVFKPESDINLPKLILAGDEPVVAPDKKGLDEHDYAIKPRTYQAKGTESLDELVDKELPHFLGKAFGEVKESGSQIEMYKSSFKRSIREINQLPENYSLKPGQVVQLPGVSQSGDPVLKDADSLRVWGSDNTIITDKDGVITSKFDGGRLVISDPRGKSFIRFENGLEETRLVNEDGSILTTRSDQTSLFYDPKNKVTINTQKDGTIETEHDSGVKVVKKTDGSVETINPDRSRKFDDGKGGVTVTDKDGLSVTTKDGIQVGQGIQFGKYSLSISTSPEGTVYSSKSTERAEFYFELRASKDGKLILKETDRELSFPSKSDSGFDSVKSEREKLSELAKASIESPIFRAKFQADMIRFENNAGKKGLKPEQIVESYRAVGRLLEPKTAETAIRAENRNILASQLMGNLGSPYSISQGEHGTCNVKSLDVAWSAKHPEVISKMVSDVAITGRYVTANGMEVVVPPSTLIPNDEAMTNPPLDGTRSYVGQVIDATLINTSFRIENAPHRLVAMNSSQMQEVLKYGDVLVDNKTGQPVRDQNGKILEFDGMDEPNLGRLAKEVLGAKYDASDKILSGRESSMYGLGLLHLRDLDQLKEVLASRKENNGLPGPIVINVKMPPFNSDTDGTKEISSSGWHVVNVVDYDPDSGKVMIDNQWKTGDDRLTGARSVDVEQLFKATLTAEQNFASIAKRVISESEKMSPVDRELKILQELKRVSSSADPDYFAGQFANQGEALGKKFSSMEKDSPEAKDLLRFYKELPATGRIGFFLSLNEAGKTNELLGSEKFQSELVNLVYKTGFDGDKLSKILGQSGPFQTDSSAELFFLAFLSRLEESQRASLLARLQVEDRKREQETLVFNALDF